MKKIVNTFLVMILAGSIPLFAANINVQPIPSFNVPVNGQQAFVMPLNTLNPPSFKGKRSVAVKSTVAGVSAPTGPIQITAVCVQTKEIRGPYYQYPGDITFIPIDDNDWGVNVNCQFFINVSIWIIDGTGFGTADPGNNTFNENGAMNPWADSVISNLLG